MIVILDIAAPILPMDVPVLSLMLLCDLVTRQLYNVSLVKL